MNGKEIYSGQWQHDQLQGKGTIKNIHLVSRKKLPEDSILRTLSYEGEFENNCMHGSGVITLASGERLEGYFINN